MTGKTPGTNRAIGGGGFHHVAVRVHDFDAAVGFYSDVLGFSARFTWGEGDKRAALLDTGDGNFFEVFAGGSAEPAAGGAVLHIALRTTDCAAAIERARAAGAQVTVEPRAITIQSRPSPIPARIGFFKGPAGEVIELFQNDQS